MMPVQDGMARRVMALALAVVAGLGLLLAACGGADAGEANQAATATALAARLGGGGGETGEGGETAVSSTDSTATDNATSTPLPPSENLQAVQATATALALEAEAAQAAAADAANANAAATAAAEEPIRAELATYGVDSSVGRLGWIHPPELLDVQGYMGYTYTNRFLATVARDFVISADITWNTQFGTTGCGFVLRTDGNEESLNQYMVIATRGAQGHVGFVTMIDGEVDLDQSQDIYANGIDPLFEWENDTTNKIAVVGRGGTFTIYTNGTEIGQITPETVYEKGFVAFVALNESGYTRCQYDNAWLWLLNE
ncbi:MAG: hypothetical protein H6668_11245 [Ardenticatenaceae bacterium]|nr:hypothetical protein [Ardenticatenaceae bacterium]